MKCTDRYEVLAQCLEIVTFPSHSFSPSSSKRFRAGWLSPGQRLGEAWYGFQGGLSSRMSCHASSPPPWRVAKRLWESVSQLQPQSSLMAVPPPPHSPVHFSQWPLFGEGREGLAVGLALLLWASGSLMIKVIMLIPPPASQEGSDEMGMLGKASLRSVPSAQVEPWVGLPV